MEEKRELPKYLHVKQTIRERIKCGDFVEKLPGERILARDFGFSYMTIRKAIDSLVEEGVLFRVPAKGTFVNRKGSIGKRTFNVGFYLGKTIKGGISSPYYSLVFKQLEFELKQEGYNLIFFTSADDIDPVATARKFDGLIVSYLPDIEKKIKEISPFVPLVLVDNQGQELELPYVGIDNKGGIKKSVSYLHSLGHRRIGFIGGSLESKVGWDRLDGYKEALADLGLMVDESYIYRGDYYFRSGYEGAVKFLELDTPPTAIACANDSMAFGAIKAIHEAGFFVPRDFSVIGFDDIEFASQFDPGLTTIKAPLEELAQQAVRMLIDQIDNRQMDNSNIVLEGSLIKRESCSSID